MMDTEITAADGPELELKHLIRSPALTGWPKLQELVWYRLQLQLTNLQAVEQVVIRVTADANYLLWVNGCLIGQGPHRNFPDTLVGEAYDIRPQLLESTNEITVLVRHMYTDTFGYLAGEPAFGLAGACDSTSLSTGSGQWECRHAEAWNEFAPRVNMHLGPLEEQRWQGDSPVAGRNSLRESGEWVKPVPCQSRERRIIPSPVAPLQRSIVEASASAEVIGLFLPLPAREGTLYTYSRPVELQNRVIAVRICSENVGENEPIFIGIRGIGACLAYADGTYEICHPYGHHLGEDYFSCRGGELRKGLLLYLIGVEHVVLGSLSSILLPADMRAVGYLPIPDPLYHFDPIMHDLKTAPPLHPFEEELMLRPVGTARLFTWKERADSVLLQPPIPLLGGNGPEEKARQGMILRLDRFRFGHFRLEVESESPVGGILDIAYGHTEDEAEQPQIFNWDRLVWSGRDGVFDNLFTPRGARYLFLSATVPIRVKRIAVAEALAPPPASMGSFRTNSPGWDGIWQTALETLRYSRTDVISSDSFRELCAWLGDTQHIALNYYYSYFDPAFIRYTWELYSRNTDQDGRMFSVVPGYMRFHLPVWTWQFWLGVRNHYLYTGDETFLRSMWPVCKQTYHFFDASKTTEGLLLNPEGWAFVDWAPIDFAGESFVLNGLYRLGVMALAELAEAAGDHDEARQLTEAAQRITAALAQPRFYDREKRLFLDGRTTAGHPASTFSQHAQILAYSMGLWKVEEQGELWERISDTRLRICTLGESSFHWAGRLLFGTPAFAPFIRHIRAVYDWKLSLGVACFGHIHPKSTPGDYRYKQNSPAHGWTASPVYLSGAFLLGVRPLAPGYKEAVIEPCMALTDVTEAEGMVPTLYGPIRVTWRAASTAGTGYVRGEVPAGVMARLELGSFLPSGELLTVHSLNGLQQTAAGQYKVASAAFELYFK